MKTFLSMILLVSTLLLCVSCTTEDTTTAKNSGTTSNPQTTFTPVIEPTTSTSASTVESTNGKPVETTTDSLIDNNAPKHYEFDLSMKNYITYLNYSVSSGLNERGQIDKNYIHTISGVLTYAYYEDVVVTFQVEYKKNSDTEWSVRTHNVRLNAAGNAEFDLDKVIFEYTRLQYSAVVTLVNVSGKVIFSI